MAAPVRPAQNRQRHRHRNRPAPGRPAPHRPRAPRLLHGRVRPPQPRRTRNAVGAPTGPPERLLTGYQQTKWVTEANLALARQRGLPVSVYRVARISGDQHTGACQTDDLLWRVVAGCVRVGAVPADARPDYDLVPVDHVAATIVALSHRPAGGTYHIANPRLTSFTTIVERLRASGRTLAEVDPAKWADLIDADPDNPAQPVADAFLTTAHNRDLTEVPLHPHTPGIHCPPITDQTLDTYLTYFTRTGWLPYSGEGAGAAGTRR
ncbi:SDR family oxidoreductase [Longispora sp. K20-0274]|uniref:SDR family oxidoreductase n=1 Tax=Longispora sp. K20-0274 TaxID=3088255 RepID=UPI003999D168